MAAGFCPNCGAVVAPDVRFCTACGHMLVAAPASKYVSGGGWAAATPKVRSAPPQYSADGKYWWDGLKWGPAPGAARVAATPGPAVKATKKGHSTQAAVIPAVLAVGAAAIALVGSSQGLSVNVVIGASLLAGVLAAIALAIKTS
jgi:hypothetical protein